MKRVILCSQYSSYIDTSSTGVSYYDDFLDPKELKYHQTHKNRTGEIVMMSPNTYYQECVDKLFHTSVDHLKQTRRYDDESLNWMNEQIQSGNKLPLPYINYANGGQEGLHRMMALGDAFGWDTEFPVLVVTVYDERKETVDEAYNDIRKAVNSAMEYSYSADELVEYFNAQIEYELEYMMDESDIPYHIIVKDSGTTLLVTAEGYEKDFQFDIDKSDIRIQGSSIDLDDMDAVTDYILDDDDVDILDLFSSK